MNMTISIIRQKSAFFKSMFFLHSKQIITYDILNGFKSNRFQPVDTTLLLASTGIGPLNWK